MGAAQALLSGALIEMQTLSESARQAQALAASIEEQKKSLEQKLDSLQKAVLLGSAPDGIALVSSNNVQLASEKNITLTASKQVDIGAIKNFTLAAGEVMSFFSRLGAKLFSAKGNIDIQAQGGEITTWSTQDTNISSGKRMVLSAQDELILVCGGGYIKLKGGNVEIGGPGKLLVKNSGIQKRGSESMKASCTLFLLKVSMNDLWLPIPYPGNHWSIRIMKFICRTAILSVEQRMLKVVPQCLNLKQLMG